MPIWKKDIQGFYYLDTWISKEKSIYWNLSQCYNSPQHSFCIWFSVHCRIKRWLESEIEVDWYSWFVFAEFAVVAKSRWPPRRCCEGFICEQARVVYDFGWGVGEEDVFEMEGLWRCENDSSLQKKTHSLLGRSASSTEERSKENSHQTGPRLSVTFFSF